MGFGRIKRKRSAHAGAEHKVGIAATVFRNDRPLLGRTLYTAVVCLGGHGNARKGPPRQGQMKRRPGCGVGEGRSPQSALAKALKRLSGTVAKRH